MKRRTNQIMNNDFPKKLINTISLGDSIELLKQLPDSSVDMLFADPPYNMQIEGTLMRSNGTEFKGVEGADWDEFESINSYKYFTRQWLTEAKSVLKKDRSSLWVIGSFQNIYLVGDVLQELGFWIINDIVWSKTNPTPNFLGTKFTNKQETLLWATPDKNTKYTFNYKTMKALNNGKQMTSVWELPVSSGKERIKDKDGNKLHPTQKPDKLMYNVIISSTKKDDIVVDPFMGSGTTGAIAKRLGRNFYGIELDKKYHDYSIERIENEVPLDDNDPYTNALFDITPPRVKFKDLVESGYVSKEEKIYFRKTDVYALISDTKELKYDGEDYGMSRLGGILSGKNTNANGWVIWHVKRDGEYISLSDLRTKYREERLGFKSYEAE